MWWGKNRKDEDRNAPDPIQGVMIGKGRERGGGRGADHYTLDVVGGIPRTRICLEVCAFKTHFKRNTTLWWSCTFLQEDFWIAIRFPNGFKFDNTALFVDTLNSATICSFCGRD